MSTDEFGNWDPGPLESGERLFVDTGESREIAMIGYWRDESRYIASYREAGEVLASHVMEDGIPDFLVFPILFAYRQWLELRLKSLIVLGQRWNAEEIKPMYTHRLELLWPLARAAMEKAFPDDPADLNTVESLIEELVAVDPQSMSFRYAQDRRGEANLPEGFDRVNVGHIASVMLQMAMLLDGAADGISEMLSNVDDYGP